ncbi:MAG: tRNA (adenosine(37)-N6)-threonylcarbamoyltransferase complex dimerization subunit type 1 TsaB [Deltaproteobacteria bacterium]|nr:tRNA (adenosine(37)-N6)-threonylcarbamoyltransferase complex dimerization subunit type 1 TsaB [Deltaproteobacteria bacterium]
MMILGIDTATAPATAALVEEGQLVSEEVQPAQTQCGPLSPITDRANHAEIILPLIDRILKGSGLSLPEISAFALSIGPGSFTGLRIGLSTVKGLAYGSDIPVVGVPTLLAVAARVIDWNGLICPFLDARKKEVYAALFRKRAGTLERLTEDLASPPERIIHRIQSSGSREPCLFIGDGIRVYGDQIKVSLGDRTLLTLGEPYPTTASAVARLGEERFRKKEFGPLGPLVPLYLRSWEKPSLIPSLTKEVP